MKVTYLVFEKGIGSALRVATKEEWNRIMQENRALPREQRRFFMQDTFEDCGSMDSLYIETTRRSMMNGTQKTKDVTESVRAMARWKFSLLMYQLRLQTIAVWLTFWRMALIGKMR